MGARILDVTTKQYHADPCETPSLSSSIAKELNAKSPLHAWQMHPRLGGGKHESSDALVLGTLMHSLILEGHADGFVVLNVQNFKTKAAQDLRDGVIADGLIPIQESVFVENKKIATKIKDRITDLGISLNGRSELKVEWTEQIGNEDPILCRGMMDHVTDATIWDLKTTRRGDLKSISRAIVDFGYDIQGAAYSSALSKLHPEFVGRTDFVLIFAEMDPPFAVTPVRFDGQLRQLGEVKWEHACLRWAQCLCTNKWPGYVDQITPIEAPPWALLETQF